MLLVLVVTTIAYVPAIRGAFIFDDLFGIRDNPSIRQLTPSVALRPPAHLPVSGRPVSNYSLAIDYAINGWLGVDQAPDPGGPDQTIVFHATNLLLHLAGGLLLFGIVRRTVRSQRYSPRLIPDADWIAVAVAAVWLLDPLQSEAVNYLMQRTELLASVCYLGTLYSAIRAGDASTRRAVVLWSAVATVVCLLGMGSKEIMLSAPLMVILYDRAFRVSSWRALLAGTAGAPRRLYAALAATMILGIALIATGARAATVGEGLGMPWYTYLYSQAWAIPHYLGLAVWPNPLSLDYGWKPIHGFAGVPGLVVLGLFGAATLVAWGRAHRWGWFGFLGAWFFLILAPSSSVVPIITEVAAERRIYLAFAAVAALAVAGLIALGRRAADAAAESSRRRWVFGAVGAIALFVFVASQWEAGHLFGSLFPTLAFRLAVAAGSAVAFWILIDGSPRAAAVAVGVIGVVFACVTYNRSAEYENPEALWQDAIATNPTNPRAFNNLASVLQREGPARLPDARDMFQRATMVDSTYVLAWYSLAVIAMKELHFDEAKPMLNRILAIQPDHLGALGRYGELMLYDSEPAGAVPYFEHALRVDTTSAPLSARLSLAFALMGRPDSAREEARRATRFGASDPAVLFIVARAMIAARALDDARAALERAVALNPRDPDAITTLGDVLLEQGHRDDAEQIYLKVLAADPVWGPAKEGLARLRAQKTGTKRDR